MNILPSRSARPAAPQPSMLLRLPLRCCRQIGWYPAKLGPGNVAAKGHVPYAILALMDMLRTFQGQVCMGGLLTAGV